MGGISSSGKSQEGSKGVLDNFSVTISVEQRTFLGSSASMAFSGEFVWKGHKAVRELISERWKNFTSSVDAAFRHGHNNVFLIKVLLGHEQNQKKCWNQH